MHYDKPLYRIMGDCSLIVELGDKINPEINRRVSALTVLLEGNPLDGLMDIVPAYRSILVVYQPLKINVRALKKWIDGKIGRAHV